MESVNKNAMRLPFNFSAEKGGKKVTFEWQNFHVLAGREVDTD